MFVSMDVKSINLARKEVIDLQNGYVCTKKAKKEYGHDLLEIHNSSNRRGRKLKTVGAGNELL